MERTRDDIESAKGLLYKEEINKRIAILKSLLEQQAPDSDRTKDIMDELLMLVDYQNVPPEELCSDLWVKDNIRIDTDSFYKI